jgi:glycosyltransferase involved in cell wall biosynthesis
MKKIIFIVNSIDNQRCKKRVEEFRSNGFSVKVYGINRGLKTSTWDNCEIIATYDNRTTYSSRIAILVKALRKVFKENRKEKNVIWYYFGVEYAMFALLLNKNRNFIYEESDLAHTYMSNKLAIRLVELIDKLIISRSRLTVLTSEGFAEYHYPKKRPANIVIKPNKLNPQIINIPDIPKTKENDNYLNFAMVGMIRYNAVRKMADIISKNFPNHQFHFFGVLNVATKKEEDEFMDLDKRDNVHFHGRFKNPDELPKVYSQIDVVVSTYDIETVNVQYAEPNKLYESIYYRTPIIVSKGTFLARQVERFQSGYSVDVSDDANIVSLVHKIEKEIKEVTKRMEMIDRKVAVDNCDELIERARKL